MLNVAVVPSIHFVEEKLRRDSNSVTLIKEIVLLSVHVIHLPFRYKELEGTCTRNYKVGSITNGYCVGGTTN